VVSNNTLSLPPGTLSPVGARGNPINCLLGKGGIAGGWLTFSPPLGQSASEGTKRRKETADP